MKYILLFLLSNTVYASGMLLISNKTHISSCYSTIAKSSKEQYFLVKTTSLFDKYNCTLHLKYGTTYCKGDKTYVVWFHKDKNDCNIRLKNILKKKSSISKEELMNQI
jgi:hypothetical protein